MKRSLLAIVASLAACSGGGVGKLTVSTQVRDGAGGSAALTTAGPASASLAIGDHVVLERSRFLIRKVMLDSGGDETTVRWGPLLVDLSGAQLDGGVTFLLDAMVPAGTYEALTFQLHKLTPGESVADPDFAPLGHSIVLDLTVDGAAYRFTSDLTAVSEILGPFTVAEGGTSNVTVSIDPSHWFSDAGGAFLDPQLEANRSQIEWNIKASIRGFQDDDLNGVPGP